MTQPARPRQGRPERPCEWPKQPLAGLPQNVLSDVQLRWAIVVPKSGLPVWPHHTIPDRQTLTGPLPEALKFAKASIFHLPQEPEIRRLDGEEWLVSTWPDLPCDESLLRQGAFAMRCKTAPVNLRSGNVMLQAEVNKGRWFIIEMSAMLSSVTPSPDGNMGYRLRAYGGKNGHRWHAHFNLSSTGSMSTTAELWTRQVQSGSQSGEHLP